AGTWLFPRYVFPSRVTATITASVLSAACMEMGFFVRTISTLTPLVNMGVMTMKMMSITNITSTMGVTLISATGGGAECFIINDMANSLNLSPMGLGAAFCMADYPPREKQRPPKADG